MARFLKSRKKAKGAAPGSYIFIGDQKMESTRIRLFQYNSDRFEEKEFKDINEALSKIDDNYINWLNIDGLHEISILQTIGDQFEISAIAFENILNTDQRSKFFEDRNSVTVISKAIDFQGESNQIDVEQISFTVFRNLLISFQERVGDHFEPVRERIRNNTGVIRKSTTDYLLFALLDSLVDNYLIGLEGIGEQIEQIEKQIPKLEDEVSIQLFQYKKEILLFRKTILPLKEVVSRILRSDEGIFHHTNMIYYKELDSLIDLCNESIGTYLNMVNDHINQFNTLQSNKENKVMKVLTVFASIFIPLTFIAGIYGTNFDYLPELHYRYSYFAMWGAMIIIAGGMLYYFRRNKWF